MRRIAGVTNHFYCSPGAALGLANAAKCLRSEHCKRFNNLTGTMILLFPPTSFYSPLLCSPLLCSMSLFLRTPKTKHLLTRTIARKYKYRHLRSVAKQASMQTSSSAATNENSVIKLSKTLPSINQNIKGIPDKQILGLLKKGYS